MTAVLAARGRRLRPAGPAGRGPAGPAGARGRHRGASPRRKERARPPRRAWRGQGLPGEARRGPGRGGRGARRRARDTRRRLAAAPPETDGDALLRCRADALRRGARRPDGGRPRTGPPAGSARRSSGTRSSWATPTRRRWTWRTTAPSTCVRGRAVEPPLAAPQEEPTAPAPKHTEPTRAAAAALGGATNVGALYPPG